MKTNKKPFLVGIIIGLCFLFCLESGFVMYFFTVGSGGYKRSLNLGNKYLLNMDYDDAIAAFSKAIDIDGMNLDAYIGRGDAYKAKNDYANAWADYEKAQELSGDSELLKEKIGMTELTIVSETGEGVDGAAVKLTGDTHSYELTTDIHGCASEILFPEKYNVEIVKEDYEPYSAEISAENGGIVAGQFELQAEPQIIDYNQLYLDYARTLQSESDSPLFMKIFESDEPVLIIAKDCPYRSYGNDGEGFTDIVSQVYQYSHSEEKIVYVGEFTSNGSARPLHLQGKSIQGAAHHIAWSLSVKDGIGTSRAVYDCFLHDRQNAAPEKAKWTLKNNEWEKTESEMISMDEADSLWYEYYGNGEILFFEPIQ